MSVRRPAGTAWTRPETLAGWFRSVGGPETLAGWFRSVGGPETPAGWFRSVGEPETPARWLRNSVDAASLSLYQQQMRIDVAAGSAGPASGCAASGCAASGRWLSGRLAGRPGSVAGLGAARREPLRCSVAAGQGWPVGSRAARRLPAMGQPRARGRRDGRGRAARPDSSHPAARRRPEQYRHGHAQHSRPGPGTAASAVGRGGPVGHARHRGRAGRSAPYRPRRTGRRHQGPESLPIPAMSSSAGRSGTSCMRRSTSPRAADPADPAAERLP